MRGLNKALHLIFARDVGSSKVSLKLKIYYMKKEGNSRLELEVYHIKKERGIVGASYYLSFPFSSQYDSHHVYAHRSLMR